MEPGATVAGRAGNPAYRPLPRSVAAGPRKSMAFTATVGQVTTIRLPLESAWNWASGIVGARSLGNLDLDSSLVERCLGGDETGWEDLVRAHSRRVYGICYRFTGNDTEAQDLTQDVF